MPPGNYVTTARARRKFFSTMRLGGHWRAVQPVGFSEG